MDLGRACYETKCRFFTDDDTEIDIRWFFARPGAKIFPGQHRFGSGNFASDPSRWSTLGEVQWAPRPFRDGTPPPFNGSIAPGYDGQKFAGPLELYQQGSPFPGRPLGTNDVGQCPACFPIPQGCQEFGTANPVVYLRITRVQTTNPIPYGIVGVVAVLRWAEACRYFGNDIDTNQFFGPLQFDFSYDALVSQYRMAGDANVFQYPVSQVFAPNFLATYVDFPFSDCFSFWSGLGLDPETWDFTISTV